MQKAAAAVRSKRAENSPDSQALYDEVRKNYNGFLMQGHTAEGIALVRQKLEALPEPWSDWEGQKRFLISLYTDTQLEAVKQSTKNGQPACLRTQSYCYRIGGDEFCVLLKNAAKEAACKEEFLHPNT